MLLPGLHKVVAWRVEQLSRRGQQASALRVAKRYVRLRHSDEAGWVLLGECLIQQRFYEEAEVNLTTGLKYVPGSPELIYLLGRSLVLQSRLRDAQALLEDAKRQMPGSFVPYMGLAEVAQRSGDSQQAIRLADMAAERIPQDRPWAKYDLAASILPLPEARTLAERLLHEASVALPPSHSRYGLAELWLGALLENSSPGDAALHLATARKHWRSHVDFDELLNRIRGLLSSSSSCGPHEGS